LCSIAPAHMPSAGVETIDNYILSIVSQQLFSTLSRHSQ
jgi:hypothetical protein